MLTEPPVRPNRFAYESVHGEVVTRNNSSCNAIHCTAEEAFMTDLAFRLGARRVTVASSVGRGFVRVSGHRSSFGGVDASRGLTRVTGLVRGVLGGSNEFIAMSCSSVYLSCVGRRAIERCQRELRYFERSSGRTVRRQVSFAGRRGLFLVSCNLMVVGTVRRLV